MGKATRWLRSLLTGKKDSKETKDKSTCKKEKKRWSFGKSGRDVEEDRPGVVAGKGPGDPAWLQAFCAESAEERNRRAIAVAAATAAAADAAAAAAQAAVAVIRLTSQGRGTMFGGAPERWAAMKIQTVFRGYLARKALRALKALVKLQALVRGYLVRRQAAAALHGMQALIRAQVAARTRRCGNLLRPRRSLERLDESRNEYAASFHSGRLSSSLDHLSGFDASPKIVEIDPGRPRSKNRRPNPTYSDGATDPPPHSSLWTSTPDRRCSFRDSDWCLTGDECRFSTAHSTPRLVSSAALAAALAPGTPAKGAGGAEGGLSRRLPQSPSNCPGYMSNTQSFEAKVRSQSAPKQRPEPAGAKKRVSLSEVVEARASLSGARMQRSCSQAQEGFGHGNDAVGGFAYSAELARVIERDHSFQRRW